MKQWYALYVSLYSYVIIDNIVNFSQNAPIGIVAVHSDASGEINDSMN